jgi:hypothetical protein
MALHWPAATDFNEGIKQSMTDRPFTTSIYAYPWDLADEGFDVALDRIAELAGCNEVLLTPCYHRGDYVLPHHPTHPIYFGEPGAIYFEPELARYAATSIEPVVSNKVTDPEYFDRIVDAIEDRELSFGAWIVYAYQHQLAATYPHFARHDVFGTPYGGQLSLAPVDVCEYFLALTQEVMDRFAPSSVFIETLGRFGFNPPPKRQVEIDARSQYLLSLCFNPASIDNANEAGMDGEEFRQQVLEYVQPRLMEAVKGESTEVASPEWIDTEFDGQLKAYIDVSRAHLSDLWLKVADIIYGRGAEVHMSLVNADSTYGQDLEPELNELCGRVCYEPQGAITSQEVERLRALASDDAKVLYYWDRHFESAEEATAILASAMDAGCDGATVYNYGLLTSRQLGHVGAAVAALP